MNFKTTFVLLALLLVAGAGMWFVWNNEPADRGRKSPETAETTKSTPVFDPQPEDKDIVKIEYAPAGKTPLTFERSLKEGSKDQYDDWRITAPVTSPSETWTVNNLVTTFARAQSDVHYEGEKAAKLTAAETGFDQPRARITFTKTDGKQLVLEIGKKRDFPTGTFVRAAGAKTIHLVEQDFSDQLKRELKDFRSKTLTKVSPNDVNRLTLETGGARFDASRISDGWVLNEPIKARGDSKKIAELISKISTLRAVDFLADSPAGAATYGFEQPFAKATLVAESHKAKPSSAPAADSQPAAPEIETITKTIEVTVGNFADLKQANRYVRIGDIPGVATVAATAVDGLSVKLPALVDSSVTGLSKDRISKLELNVGGQSATLERKDGKWVGVGDLAALDTDAVITLVTTLQDLRSISVVEDAETLKKTGLDTPRATITASMEGAVNPVALRVGANTGSGLNTYVALDSQPVVYVVDAKEAAKLIVPPLALRSRAIVDAKPEDVTKIDRAGGPITYSLAREGATWKLTQPADAQLDLGAAQELATDLSRLRAKRVVARDQDAEYGLDKPTVTVKFTLQTSAPPAGSQPAEAAPPAPGPAVERALRVAWKDKAAFARLESEPFIYELDESVYKVLTGELLKRDLFDLAPESVTGLRVESPTGTLDFVKEGADWKFGPDPFVKLAPDKMKTFVADVTKLRADEYSAYRDAAAPAETPITVTIKQQNGAATVLKIGPSTGENQPRIGYLPALQRSFKVRPIDVENLLRSLDYFLASDKPAPGQPGGPPIGIPGQRPGMPPGQ